jgi:hypothetical protein
MVIGAARAEARDFGDPLTAEASRTIGLEHRLQRLDDHYGQARSRASSEHAVHRSPACPRTAGVGRTEPLSVSKNAPPIPHLRMARRASGNRR